MAGSAGPGTRDHADHADTSSDRRLVVDQRRPPAHRMPAGLGSPPFQQTARKAEAPPAAAYLSADRATDRRSARGGRRTLSASNAGWGGHLVEDQEPTSASEGNGASPLGLCSTIKTRSPTAKAVARTPPRSTSRLRLPSAVYLRSSVAAGHGFAILAENPCPQGLEVRPLWSIRTGRSRSAPVSGLRPDGEEGPGLCSRDDPFRVAASLEPGFR